MSGRDESGLGSSTADDIAAAWDEAERGGGSVEGGGDAGGLDAGSRGAAGGDVADGGVERKQNIDAGTETGEKGLGTGERARDEHGRFAKKEDGEADPKAAAPADAAAADPKAGEGQPKAQESHPGESLPSNWNDINADDWGKTPASVRAKITEREAQVAQGFQQIGQDLAELNTLSKARGISWRDGLKRLTEAQRTLEQSPYQAMLSLAQMYKVNLDDLAEMAAGTMAPPALQSNGHAGNGNAGADPVMQRLQALESQIQAQQASPLLKEIEAFKTAEAEFFDDLILQINANIPAVKAAHPGADHRTVLRLAYSAAVAIRPDIQAKVKANAEAKAAKERAAAEEKERQRRGGVAASVHLAGQPGGSHPSALTSVGSVADDLLKTWDELAAR